LKVFFDSSALLKRYIHESGSDKVLRLGFEAREICLSAICYPEVVSGLRRIRVERKIPPEVYDLLKSDFGSDLEQAEVEAVGPDVIRESAHCVERTGLKASDAIHVATALRCGVDLFVTGDSRQAKGAREVGLKVEVV
jgi:uncharacterized protein